MTIDSKLKQQGNLDIDLRTLMSDDGTKIAEAQINSVSNPTTYICPENNMECCVRNCLGYFREGSDWEQKHYCEEE